MGTRGPSPTPTHTLKLHGSWRGDLNHSEPAASTDAPDCPAWLDDYAREEWERVTASLSGMGLLSADDRALLVAYCVAWADFRLASETLQCEGWTVEGKFGEVKHPLVSVKEKASDRLLRLAQQFGLSPSARARISVPEKKADDSGKKRFFQTG